MRYASTRPINRALMRPPGEVALARAVISSSTRPSAAVTARLLLRLFADTSTPVLLKPAQARALSLSRCVACAGFANPCHSLVGSRHFALQYTLRCVRGSCGLPGRLPRLGKPLPFPDWKAGALTRPPGCAALALAVISSSIRASEAVTARPLLLRLFADMRLGRATKVKGSVIVIFVTCDLRHKNKRPAGAAPVVVRCRPRRARRPHHPQRPCPLTDPPGSAILPVRSGPRGIGCNSIN
jgi:hypothetical protein